MLADLGREGVARVDVCCPGFVADCLETLEEIGIEGRRTFLGAGGKPMGACGGPTNYWADPPIR